jgi:hypothetical protein
MRDLVAGGLLAALLVACSAASPTTPSTDNLNATAAAGLDAASTAVPGLESTAAAGVDVASTAVATAGPGLQATAESATGMTAGDLTAMLGQTVTVTGPVTNIYSAILFSVDDAIGDGNGVLVMAPTASFTVGEGQVVEASGILQQFEIAQLEQSLGIDLDDAALAEFSGRPVLIADQVSATQ